MDPCIPSRQKSLGTEKGGDLSTVPNPWPDGVLPARAPDFRQNPVTRTSVQA